MGPDSLCPLSVYEGEEELQDEYAELYEREAEGKEYNEWAGEWDGVHDSFDDDQGEVSGEKWDYSDEFEASGSGGEVASEFKIGKDPPTDATSKRKDYGSGTDDGSEKDDGSRIPSAFVKRRRL